MHAEFSKGEHICTIHSTTPPHPQEPEQGINQNGDHVLMSTCSACVSMYVILYHTILIGVWLGDPRSHHSEGKKVWIEGAHPERVSAAVSVSYDAEKLALNYCQLCLL